MPDMVVWQVSAFADIGAQLVVTALEPTATLMQDFNSGHAFNVTTKPAEPCIEHRPHACAAKVL